MARTGAVWGIDIGQCALKALRCRAHDQEGQLVAEAFDYIEYPKILSQAGADPGELIADALKQFLSRNSVRGDHLAISVSGQSGLARFIKLPPVEAKKIPDIVRYEARQQIPFDLNDVIWDYQRMGGGSEEEGFALETEIGLFAMKRDAVFRALEPFQKAGIEVDFVQLTPLALYNFLLFDQLVDLPPADEYDPEAPPKSTVILSLGTDSTDLVVTNGFRVWQRSIPLGGSHFTKALTKELKLTFAKAEHLKRNASAAQDPKAVFQAMRPVFSDLLTEVQRSIGFFSSIDRAAEIKRIVALGNAAKLPGLRRYLAQNLEYEVVRLDEFRGLVGSEVVNAPVFKENILSFGVCYGLVLQALGKSGLRTNLLPKEIVHDRLIRQKKPWVVAAAATMLLACGISFATFSRALSSVDQGRWESAVSRSSDIAKQASGYRTDAEGAKAQFDTIDKIGSTLVGNVEGRILWLEMLHALNKCLPSDPPDKRPTDIAERNELHVDCVEAVYMKDLAAWFAAVKPWYQPPPKDEQPPSAAAGADAATPGDATSAGQPAGQPADQGAGGAQAPAEDSGPTEAGWVIMVTGYHYHNFNVATRPDWGPQYVRNTLIKNLQSLEIELPASNRTDMDTVSMQELGIQYPVLVDQQKVRDFTEVNPYMKHDAATSGSRSALDSDDIKQLRRFDFSVHYHWKPTTPSQRESARKQPETPEQPNE